MSTAPLCIGVDLTNPGQFFACCGLLELADRLWNGAEGWFSQGGFFVRAIREQDGTLEELLDAMLSADIEPIDADDEATMPLHIGKPFDLRLDWWQDKQAGGGTFKTWAGQQKVVNIAKAMHRALDRARPLEHELLQFGEILPDPEDPKRSVAPFYFDARRASGAHNLDIGFSNDALKIETLSFPCVEFLCLVGLQRFRPNPNQGRTFSYFAWPETAPLRPSIASAVACGFVPVTGSRAYSFRLLFRTKYLKGFLSATRDGGDPWPT